MIIKNIDKLVRNNVLEAIKSRGDTPEFHIANNEEYFEYLKKKLIEEVNEYLNDLNIDEFADVAEVMRTIADLKNIDYLKLEESIEKKNQKAGKFTKRIILDRIIVNN